MSLLGHEQAAADLLASPVGLVALVVALAGGLWLLRARGRSVPAAVLTGLAAAVLLSRLTAPSPSGEATTAAAIADLGCAPAAVRAAPTYSVLARPPAGLVLTERAVAPSRAALDRCAAHGFDLAGSAARATVAVGRVADDDESTIARPDDAERLDVDGASASFERLGAETWRASWRREGAVVLVEVERSDRDGAVDFVQGLRLRAARPDELPTPVAGTAGSSAEAPTPWLANGAARTHVRYETVDAEGRLVGARSLSLETLSFGAAASARAAALASAQAAGERTIVVGDEQGAVLVDGDTTTVVAPGGDDALVVLRAVGVDDDDLEAAAASVEQTVEAADAVPVPLAGGDGWTRDDDGTFRRGSDQSPLVPLALFALPVVLVAALVGAVVLGVRRRRRR